jgi:hypothetical protein
MLDVGWWMLKDTSVGDAGLASVIPTGLSFLATRAPALETLGYSRWSLRDRPPAGLRQNFAETPSVEVRADAELLVVEAEFNYVGAWRNCTRRRRQD